MDYRKMQRSLAPLLAPLGSAYSALMRLRAAAYGSGLKKSLRPKALCVAVGNIAWGGSGKTPIADWLLGWGKEQGLSCALLTRGYGGKSAERPLLVKASTSPNRSGDEPLLLARRHPNAYILADPKRARALGWLEANTNANFIVLDDAMQHLALERDLNLTLLRAKDLRDEFWGKALPAGEWREGQAALGRASAFLLRLGPEDFAAAENLIKQRLGAYGKPVFSFTLAPVRLAPLGGSESALHDLGGRPYALCTGVGSPEQVAESAHALLGAAPAKSFIYPDHHKFSAADIKRVAQAALPVVLTAKDAVKMEAPTLNTTRLEAYVLESRVVFGPHLFCADSFEDWLAGGLRKLPAWSAQAGGVRP